MTSENFDKKYKALNERQKAAVDTIYGPVLVVAGPGTGKTTVLTLRIANILQKIDAKPDEILALTFTENGARTMRERLRELIGDTAFRVNIFTFHGFANYVRSIYPENFSKIGERAPASDADKIEIVESLIQKKSFRELRISEYGVSISKISGRISDLKRELVTPDILRKILKKEEHKPRLDEFAGLYEAYEEEMEKRKLYDFDDAILELIRALKENPEMRAEMRERFQFILADEHQDANGAQNEILKLFKNDKEADSPNIFVVGDDKQSIFRFQGASLEHFYGFAHEFKGAKKIELADNYRSQATILKASHNLISHDGRKHEELLSNAPHKEQKIEINEYDDYDSELADVAKQIKDLKGSVAVISRHNQTLFDLASFLHLEGIKFNIKGERSLFDDFEYQRLLSLLEALCDPFDGRLLMALYAGYFAVPTHDLLLLASRARKERRDSAELILAEGSDVPNSSLMKDLIAKAKKLFLTEMLKEIRDVMYANSRPEMLSSLRAIFDEARKLVIKKRHATLDDLVSHLKFLEKHRLAPLGEEERKGESVELLSIHRAKGLEYDYVFIVDATAKKFDGGGKRGDLLAIPGIGISSELEEERRLLYVAITRTRKHLVISYSLQGEKGEDNKPSVLLDEIGADFVVKKLLKDIDKPDILKIERKRVEEKIAEYREAFLTRSFSVSALNNYLGCPWKYFFRNLLLIPDAPEYYANLGNACHNALKEFHLAAKKGKPMDKEDLRLVVKKSVIAEPFSESELPLALEKASEYVCAYAASFVPFKEGEMPHIEEAFSFGLPLLDFEIKITGKIDLARENDNVFSVIDFKTKKRMTPNAIKGLTKSDDGNEWRQLEFYKYLIENALPGFKVATGTLTFLVPEDERILSEFFMLSEQDKKEIEELVKNTLLSIYNFDFWNRKCDDKKCDYCALSAMIR